MSKLKNSTRDSITMEGEAGVAGEYFFASDASAIIEHTNRVIFLEVLYCNVLYTNFVIFFEDDDVAAVRNGTLSIHRVNAETGGAGREITTLKMELQQIMKVVITITTSPPSCRRRYSSSPSRW